MPMGPGTYGSKKGRPKKSMTMTKRKPVVRKTKKK